MVKGNRPLTCEVERLPDQRLELVSPAGRRVAEGVGAVGAGGGTTILRAMWRALVAGIVFQHVSVDSLLQLRRNPALLDVCGFDPMGPRRRPKRTGGLGPKDRGGSAVEVELLPKVVAGWTRGL